MNVQQFGPPRQVVASIYEIAPEALEQIALWLEQRGSKVPASSITGLRGAVGVFVGTGTPEAVVTAPIGSLYRRIDGGAGTSLYVKESGAGNTGWVGK